MEVLRRREWSEFLEPLLRSFMATVPDVRTLDDAIRAARVQGANEAINGVIARVERKAKEFLNTTVDASDDSEDVIQL